MDFIELMDPRIVKLEKSDQMFEDSSWVMEPKLSGRRIQARVLDGIVSFAGRYGADGQEDLDDLSLKLRHISASLLSMGVPNGTMLDGEVHIPNNFTDTMRILNSPIDRAIQLQEELGFLRYTVFDLPYMEHRSLVENSLQFRQAKMRTLLGSNDINVETIASFPTDLKSRRSSWNTIVASGHEGVVFKLNEAPYEFGKSKWWRKLKTSATYDGVIRGFKLSNKNPDDLVSSVEVGQYRNGALVTVARVGNISNDESSYMRQNMERLVGKVVQFRADSKTETSYKNPRFDCLRNDKAPERCLWNPGE